MTRITSFTRQGLTFDVLDQGPEDGPVVLLLHGFPQDARCWDSVTERLNAQGLRTLAMDQRGYSPGARPTELAAYRREELSGDALALADEAGAERFHLVGHDWGGVLAWDIALRAPERLLAGRVGTLTRRAGIPEEAAERYERRFATADDLRGPINWYRAMLRKDGVTGKNAGNGIITMPTTFVWGNRDPALGRTAAEETEVYVHAPYEFIELDAGHWLPEREAPAVAEAIVDRISSVTSD